MKTARRKNEHPFQWLRDIRAEMNREMEGMTPEEISAYIRAGALEARKKLPHYTPEEARKKFREILYPAEEACERPEGPARAKASSAPGRAAGRKTAAARGKAPRKTVGT